MEKRKILIIIILALLFVCVLFAVSGTFFNQKEKNEFRVVCLNVGKADAFLLLSKNSTVLIDTGLDSSGKDILSYLEKENITTIDYLIITHFDKDHVGGADQVIEEMYVKNVLQSHFHKNSDEYKEYVITLQDKKMTPIIVTKDLSFTLDGIHYSIFPPQKDSYTDKDSNNSSLIVRVVHGENSFLFTGDAEEERLLEFLSSNPATTTFLKVPYHGHYLSILPSFFQAVSPKYAVITSSEEEPEDQKTVEELQARGCQVYLTREGTVTWFSDGKKLYVKQ